jgi:CHASE2 domain-containing sensor protein
VKFLSYDLPVGISAPKPAPPEVVMIYLDDESFSTYHQTVGQAWDLDLHAQFLDRMTQGGARVVVFDILFNLPSGEDKIKRFAQAIARNGKVVLAATLETHARPGFKGTNSVLPLPELQDAAKAIGYALLPKPPDMVRQYHRGLPQKPSLPWAAAQVAGLEITKEPAAREPDTWLNYYGPSLTLSRLSYAATNIPFEFFSNKFIFVGELPKTLMAQQEADAFCTPHSRLGGQLMPGVEIGATAFANLLRQDGLKLWDERRQGWLMLAAGLVIGGGLTLLRPWVAGAVAAIALVVLTLIVQAALQHHVWFAWSVIAFAQVPVALAWSIGGQFISLRFHKEVAERTLSETTKLVELTRATAAQKPASFVPDHSLVRLVGRGAYGEVWLARNAIGAYHVVKLVRRRGFPSDAPYEREFRGIQKFMPISRTHAGFVHILHVGRNDEEKFYYCIMEAGDDRASGQTINPDTYQPKTLGTEMEQSGKIPAEEGLRLGLALSDALEHLHRHQLIHRDIKPPNIIYVHGAPKFADIGLVTDIAGDPKDISQLGTEGYMAPEGPGTPAADVYSLGKVLYEAVMGRDRRMFPEVPTAVFEQPSDSLLRQLNDIIFKACESKPEQRYASARELHEALRQVKL